MEEWHIPRKTASKRVRYQLQTRTGERLSARHHRQSWRRFLDSESHFTAVQKECATPPHVQVHHTVYPLLCGKWRLLVVCLKLYTLVKSWNSCMECIGGCIWLYVNGELFPEVSESFERRWGIGCVSSPLLHPFWLLI